MKLDINTIVTIW